MARAAPQSQPYNRANSSSSRHSRQTSSSSIQTTSSGSSGGQQQQTKAKKRSNSIGGGNKKLTYKTLPYLPYLLSVPLSILQFLFSIGKLPFGGSKKSIGRGGESEDDENTVEEDADDVIKSVLSERGLKTLDDTEYLSVQASPGLTTLLDDALYRAYKAELVPTVMAASQLLTEFVSMKEASALILRECRWMAGVPLSGELRVFNAYLNGNGKLKKFREVAMGTEKNGIFFGGGVFMDQDGNPVTPTIDVGEVTRYGFSTDSDSSSGSSNASADRLHSEEMNMWNEFDTILDFARQCYESANEAIQRLTTDRLAESANLTLQDSIASTVGNEGEAPPVGPQGNDSLQQAPGAPAPSTSPSFTFLSPADAGIGRCYHAQPRRDCWESPRLYCPDYYWADEAIGGCQRLLKALSKHRFVSLVTTHGWDRYSSVKAKSTQLDKDGKYFQNVPAPTNASCTPHIFPSLEAVHALQYLTSELLPSSIPSCLNQFRAAVESNAVVSKRLYLVKCEYRAPLRALWESYINLNAAPKVELVERYLKEFHRGAAGSGGGGEAGASGKGSSVRRKGSQEKSAIQQQREKLEVSSTSPHDPLFLRLFLTHAHSSILFSQLSEITHGEILEKSCLRRGATTREMLRTDGD